MALIHQINSSQFEFGNRIDAELYNPILKKSYGHLFQTGFEIKQLKTLCLIRSGTTPADRVEGLSKGSILFKTTDIRNKVISPTGDYYRISKEIHNRMSRTCLQEYDVLLNIVGATLDVIGRTGFIEDLPEEANITQAMVFLRCKSHDLKPGYLFTYLNSRFAQDQIKRFARPTGQYNLNLQEVGQLHIPFLPPQVQTIIHNLVILSSNEQDKSDAGYNEAQHLLESELGLDKLSFQIAVGYTAQLSEIEQSRRFDPEHYFPAFKNLLNHLPPGVKVSPLSSHLCFCQRGKQPNYAKQGLPVINSRHVQPNRVILEGNRRAAANPISDLQIRFGDVLLNGTGRGTIGRAAPYLQQSEAVPDNHVTILRSPDLDPVFISLYLNSIAGQLQVEMHQRGTSGQLELYPFDIRRFLVWDAPEGLQKELRSLCDQAAAAERTSKELLEEAKTRVEQLIEEAVKS